MNKADKFVLLVDTIQEKQIEVDKLLDKYSNLIKNKERDERFSGIVANWKIIKTKLEGKLSVCKSLLLFAEAIKNDSSD
jgi:hypothetical protein